MVVASNAILLYIIFIFISQSGNAVEKVGNINFSQANLVSNTTISPIDQVSSANIALTVAQMTNLPETKAISNQAQSQQSEINLVSTNNEIVSKPQIVATALKSRADIFYYVTAPGDTLASLATKFGVSENSISWSNNLIYNNLTVGQKLVIPPINGIVYKVKLGDTPASLAKTYNSSASQIISYNDAEITGLVPGEEIIIPNGVNPVTYTSAYSSSYFPWGTNPIYGYNGYYFGWCTWYVATQISIPSNWGDAYNWANAAAQSPGWNVGSTPAVGDIAQTTAGDHVAVVRAVNPNGTIWISEMNSYGQKSMTNATKTGGWDVIDWKQVSDSFFPHYIYR